MPDTNELREKIQDVLDACGNHSLSEDTIIYIKDTLGIFVSKKLARARAEGEKEGIMSSRQLISDVLNSLTDADAMKWVNIIRREGLKKD